MKVGNSKVRLKEKFNKKVVHLTSFYKSVVNSVVN